MCIAIFEWWFLIFDQQLSVFFSSIFICSSWPYTNFLGTAKAIRLNYSDRALTCITWHDKWTRLWYLVVAGGASLLHLLLLWDLHFTVVASADDKWWSWGQPCVVYHTIDRSAIISRSIDRSFVEKSSKKCNIFVVIVAVSLALFVNCGTLGIA